MYNLAIGTLVKLPATYGPYPFWIIEAIDGETVTLSTDDGEEIDISRDELVQDGQELTEV